MAGMTLEQLKVFVAVAERQHMTRAAEALNLTQSAASAAIAHLELRYGTKLFDRIGRGIALTEAGRVFLHEARAVLARAEAAELALSELGGLNRGTLRLAASQTIASYWLPHHLVTFRRTHPGVDIRLTIGNTTEVAGAVHSGSVELGFVEGAVDNPLLTSRTVARDQMLIVVGLDHAWVKCREIAPNDLCSTDWVLREPGSGTRSVFEQELLAHGISPIACASCWSCRRTRRSARPWKPGWVRQRSPPRWRCRASKPDCCMWRRSRCPLASSKCCATANAPSTGRRMHCST